MSNELDKRDDSFGNNNLYSRIADLIEHVRQKAASVVNLTMVHTYFEVGRMIVEDEQKGEDRAEYGKAVLKELSTRLTGKFGKGFSVDNLQNMRRFYLTYSIYETPSRKLEKITENHSPQITNTEIQNTESRTPQFRISWSHYLILLRIDNPNERSFYEIESASNNWSLAELKRQYHSSLYECLTLSRNKEDVMKLANEGHV